MKPEETPFPAVVDSTMRSAFVECPQKFYQSYVLNLAPKGKSIHLVAGGAFAKGLEVTRKAFWDFEAPPEEAIEMGMAAAIAAYDPEVNEPGHQKSLDRVLVAMTSYFQTYPLGEDPIKPFCPENSEKHSIEFSFAIPLPIMNVSTGEPIIYSGRFDLLGVFQDAIWVVDEKTATQLGASWGRKFDLRAQMTGYCWGAREYGYPVAGAIIRGIGFLKTQITHAQVMTHRAPWLVDRWYAQLLRDIQRMQECYTAGIWDYAYGDACDAYGGCQFLNVCTKEDPTKWYPMYFEHRKWDPLHKED